MEGNTKISNFIQTYMEYLTWKMELPLIAGDISAFYQHRVQLLLSGPVVAEKLKFILEKENMLSKERTRENEYIVSDLAKNFEKSAEKFYGTRINLKEVKL